MKLLRDDLIIRPAEDDSSKFIVRNPSTNEQFEFGEREFYVINEIRKPYHERVLLTKFNAKFGEKKTLDYLNELIGMFDGWGLLVDEGKTQQETYGDNEEAEIISGGRTKKRKINHLSLFCPQKILDAVVDNFKDIRYLFFVLFPALLIIALVGLIFNVHNFSQDLHNEVFTHFTWLKHLIYTLFTINILTVIMKGCISRYYGVDVHSFGFTLAFGLIPEFDIRMDMQQIRHLDKKAKLWLYSASLLIRIFLFSLGVIMWMITRHQGTLVPILSQALAWYSLVTLLLVWNPLLLLGNDANRFFSVYFNVSNLRERANRSLRYLFFSPPAVIKKYTRNILAWRVYALICLVMLIVVAVMFGNALGPWLKKYYSGLGIVLFVVIVAYIFLRYRHYSRILKELNSGRPIAIEKPASAGGTVTAGENRKPWTIMNKISPKGLVYLLIGIAVVIILFLPYRYDSGGSSEVLPVLRQGIYPENKGIIRHVYYNGQEKLKKGTVIAEMENYEYRKNVEETREAIKKQREDILALMTTPSAEQVELAEEQLRTAKQKVQYSTRDYANKEQLYKKDLIAEMDYLYAREKMELDKQDVMEKEDALKALKAQVNEHTLEAAKRQLAMLQRDLQYYEEQLEKTKLRMPNDGQIITMNLKNLENKFLDDAQLFAEAEDSSHVRIEISIPESDVDQVAIGNKVSFKALLYPTRAFTGAVESIYPTADPEQSDSGSTVSAGGKIVKVVSIFPNESGMLKSGMTGYSKIEGDKMFVAQAFTRALIRFILIEFWSWLP